MGAGIFGPLSTATPLFESTAVGASPDLCCADSFPPPFVESAAAALPLPLPLPLPPLPADAAAAAVAAVGVVGMDFALETGVDLQCISDKARRKSVPRPSILGRAKVIR